MIDREVAAVAVGLLAAPAGFGSRNGCQITGERGAVTVTVLQLIVHHGSLLSSEG